MWLGRSRLACQMCKWHTQFAGLANALDDRIRIQKGLNRENWWAAIQKIKFNRDKCKFPYLCSKKEAIASCLTSIQFIFHATAWVIFLKHKSDHVTSLLKIPQQCPIALKIKTKLINVAFEILHAWPLSPSSTYTLTCHPLMLSTSDLRKIFRFYVWDLFGGFHASSA